MIDKKTHNYNNSQVPTSVPTSDTEVGTDPLSILKRILLLAGSKNDIEIAMLLGLSPSSISAARTSKKVPLKWLPLIADKFHVTVDWLLTGVGPMYRQSGVTAEFSDHDNYYFVPLPEGSVRAGPDGGVLYDQPIDHYPFKRKWLAKITGSNSDDRLAGLVVIRVTGDSMTPTINPGELVLVDTWEDVRLNPRQGRVYLVRMPDALITIKRVVVTAGNDHLKMICLSDNINMEPFDFVIEPDRPITWHVLGRIRWVGREMD